MKFSISAQLKNILVVLCGLALLLQTTGCRLEERANEPSQEKDQPVKPGPGEGGGGDPDTQRFVFLSLKLARFYSENPAHLDLPFSASDFTAKVTTLDASIKDPVQTDLISFTDTQLFDSSGVPKVALFDRQRGIIQVNRAYWMQATDEDKFVLIHMEIAGLMGLDVRYEQALALIKDRAALIFAMPVSAAGESTPISWWIAGQDPNIFSRISTNDIIIDGEVIGTGTDSNQKVVEFLKNPAANSAWYSRAQQAFAKGLPAYLLLRDPSGTRASLTAFRKTTKGFPTYTLLFYARSKPVGLCAHHSNQISVLDRIKNCFFDTRFYGLSDTDSQFADLAESLQNHYSSSQEVLESALQFYLIQDYSGLFAPHFRNYVLRKMAKAHGLTPHLSKGDVAFWQQSETISEPDLRFYKALEKMAEDRMGFYPGQEPRCFYIDKDGKEQNSTDEKPRIVKLNDFHQLIEQDACILRFADGLDAKFYLSLAQEGYVYDPLKHQWNKGAPRTVSPDLMVSRFRIVNEIETKIVAENLSPTRSEQLIQSILEKSDFNTRLLVFDLIPRWRKLGLKEDQALRLYRKALRDVRSSTSNPKASPEDLEWATSNVYPLESFVSTIFAYAANGILVSEDFSKEAINEILQAPWINSQSAQNILLFFFRPRNGISTDNWELALTSFFKKDYFDAPLAERIYSQLIDADSASPQVKLRIFNQLLSTEVKFTEDPKEWIQTQKQFQIAAEIERKIKSQNLSTDEQAQIYVDIIKAAKDSTALDRTLMQFLSENKINPSTLTQLLDEFMLLIQRENNPSAGLKTLAEIAFRIPMTEEQREIIYRFVLLSFKNKEDSGARNYFTFKMKYVKDQSLDVRASYQLLLELIAQSSQQKIGEVGLLPDLKAKDFTEARDLVRLIEECRLDPLDAICAYIKSPHRILSFIVNNKNISEPTRQAARTELRLRH